MSFISAKTGIFVFSVSIAFDISSLATGLPPGEFMSMTAAFIDESSSISERICAISLDETICEYRASPFSVIIVPLIGIIAILGDNVYVIVLMKLLMKKIMNIIRSMFLKLSCKSDVFFGSFSFFSFSYFMKSAIIFNFDFEYINFVCNDKGKIFYICFTSSSYKSNTR